MITDLDHVNIETDDLDGTVAFYQGVLGMESKAKPSGNSGVWLYVGGRAVVHVNVVDEGAASTPANLNHIAFAATDLTATTTSLDQASVAYEVVERPGLGITQVLCRDPNNIPLELNVATEF